jgi:hypothetical protein
MSMRSKTWHAGLQRVITGNRCEVQGCYEMALWLVTFKDENSHLCGKHTRSCMRNMSFWNERLSPIDDTSPLAGIPDAAV